jgi:hypothetical protein
MAGRKKSEGGGFEKKKVGSAELPEKIMTDTREKCTRSNPPNNFT